MGGDSPPPAPDYAGAAQATAQGNLDNLKYQTAANRPTIVTPFGTQSWTQGTTVDQAGYDAALKAWQAQNNAGTWHPATTSSFGSGEGGGETTTPGYWDGATPNGQPAPKISDYTRDNAWTENVTLDPKTEAALKAQQDVQMTQSQLAQRMQSQVADTMSTPFNAPSLNSYLGNVGNVNTNFGGFNANGVNGVNQSYVDSSPYTSGAQPVDQTLNSSALGQMQNFRSIGSNVNLNPSSFVASAGRTNLNAPQFSDATAAAGAKAAYNASHGLIADQQQQDTTNLDSQLRLQGLMPGTEAYNTAAQNLSRTQSQQNDQLANQAVLSGNAMANANYASALSGYNSGNAAQNQAYNQGANTFTLGNTASGQKFNQDATGFGLTNAARSTQYNQDVTGMNTNNAARTQALANGLSQYQTVLQSQQAQNQAQSQAFNQSLAGYGANETAIANQNAAQAQAYQQAMGTYNTAYNSAYQNYLTPLNSMNAVLYGNQVQNPNFGSFATAGNTAGPDYTTAAQNQGQYDSAANAASTASSNSTTGAVVGLVSAAAIAY